MTGRTKFKKYKSFIIALSKVMSLLGYNFNLTLFNFFRYLGGHKGILIRYVLAKNLFNALGDNVSISEGVYFFNLKNINIGSNVSIHPMCYIEGAGVISIGDNVSIAHSTSLISTNHTWQDLNQPIKYNKETFGKIIINDDVWIACGVRILSGVKISQRSVVAAGAVVNKSFDSNSVIGGIPAKLIKKI